MALAICSINRDVADLNHNSQCIDVDNRGNRTCTVYFAKTRYSLHKKCIFRAYNLHFKRSDFFFVFMACFVYIRFRFSGQPQIMALRAHLKSQNMLGILVLQLCYMATCGAVDQQHCFDSHKDITKACGDGSNECICALQKVRCTQPSKCDSTLISKNQVCVNELNNDEDLWFANCGIYHDIDLTMTIVGWVLVSILSILIGSTMYKKYDDPDYREMYFNAAIAVFFAGVIIFAAMCFRDVFLVFMVSMVCVFFIIITSALVRTGQLAYSAWYVILLGMCSRCIRCILYSSTKNIKKIQ